MSCFANHCLLNPARLAGLFILPLLSLLLTAGAATATTLGPSTYGDTYTAEELAALATALQAGNMTMADLQFDKDYAAGYECYASVRGMMDDPLMIGSFMDNMADSAALDPADLLRLLINADSLARIEHNSDWAAAAPGSDVVPLTREFLASRISDAAAALPVSTIDEESRANLRSRITAAMCWHDIEGGNSSGVELPEPGTELYELLLQTEARPTMEYSQWFALSGLMRELANNPDLFPTDHIAILQTPLGQMALGTPGDDYYSGDFAILIDPGGNDTYHNCRLGAAYGQRSYGPRLGSNGEPTGASADFSPLGDGRFGFFADLGGNDLYDCADVDITLGAAVLGTAAFYDLGGGDDRYYAGSISLGSAMAGIATFYDDGGSDFYSGKVYTQGAAAFGIGIMYDDSVGDTPQFDTAEGNEKEIDAHERDAEQPNILSSVDNDTYSAWSEAQAFARTRGVALCINTRGNEIYEAGGVYLHAPLFGDRYQSFSQGFAIGEREIDYAGGIAMLIDYEGNDRYLGDIYNQGVGYWYSGGFLWDGAGNDLYEMTQYGQGSGIHLAVGGLVDVSGSDSYIMHSGLGQGGSHDYAASVFHDRGGDDRYFGNTSCNGTGLTNSVGIFIDRAGNDTYAARKDGSLNAGRPARDNGSIGVLVDLSGTDSYLGDGGQADSSMWTNSQTGMGWDIAPPTGAEETANTSGPNVAPAADIPMPEIIAYEGELTQEVFDELWEIAIRWEVGDNQAIVPKARERIVAFGMPVLPYVIAEMEDDYSLAVRAFDEIFPPLMQLDREAVLEAIRKAGNTELNSQRTCVQRVVGDLKLSELSDIIIRYFDDPQQQRRAVAVIGMIDSHAADAELLAMLSDPATDEKLLQAAIISAASLKLDCAAQFSSLLDHEHVSVRESTVGQLVKMWVVYGTFMLPELRVQCEMRCGERPLDRANVSSVTRLRCLLEVLQRVDAEPDIDTVDGVAMLLGDEDWGLRADAIALLQKWQGLENPAAARQITAMQTTAELLMPTEKHPYVLNVWQQGH